MNRYYSLIKFTLICILIGSGIFYWGYVNTGIIRMLIGIIFILIFIKSGIDNYKYIKELNEWIAKNQGRLIFFYPTKKSIQEKIQEKILPFLINEDILQVYYDGPKLIGDIKRSIIVEMMNSHKEIKVNSPSIFKIIGDDIYLENLKELQNIEHEEVDIVAIRHKFDKIKNANA